MESKLLTFSIVVPTYARPIQMNACLNALSQLNYPRHSFEVIVVDDGSKNYAEELVGNYRDSLDIRLVSQEHGGPAKARNTGARNAKNEFVVFTDDDCVPLADWLRKLAIRFTALPDHGIVGRTVNGLPENPYSAASQMVVDYLCSYYNSASGDARFFTSSNVAFPLEHFLKIGGFDPLFRKAAGEDRDLSDRWMRLGYQLTYAPEVIICHRHILTFPKFCRQQFNYGRGGYQYHRLRAARNEKRLEFEPISFYLNLIRYPSIQKYRRPIFQTLLMGVSQVATVGGFLWEKLASQSQNCCSWS